MHYLLIIPNSYLFTMIGDALNQKEASVFVQEVLTSQTILKLCCYWFPPPPPPPPPIFIIPMASVWVTLSPVIERERRIYRQRIRNNNCINVLLKAWFCLCRYEPFDKPFPPQIRPRVCLSRNDLITWQWRRVDQWHWFVNLTEKLLSLDGRSWGGVLVSYSTWT